jgi:hypothetical protein
MIKMGKESKLVPSELVEKAVAFFGPSGQGMNVVEQDDCCARFEGAGGYVFVQAADIEGKRGSQVTVEGREWEYQIKQFMGEI